MREDLNREQVFVAVDILAMAVWEGKLNLMLSRRKDPPCDGKLALPGRFIGQKETAEMAVRRLMEEMIPVSGLYLEQLYTFTEVDRDPRGRVISVAYLVIMQPQKLEELMKGKDRMVFPCRISTGSASQELILTDGTRIAGSELAFDHGCIIETGIQRLRGKIDYTDIGFRFLRNTEAFSLSELQTVYEAVLGMQLDSSNFRRTILNRYEKTGRLWQTAREEKRGRGRPAVLYRFDL